MPVNLSTAQLLSFMQCPRRFWLEQYHPEHEGDVTSMDAFLDAGEAASAAARESLRPRGVTEVSGHLGLRKAIEQTTDALEHGCILLDATLEHEGVTARIDMLDWSSTPYRAVSVTAESELTSRHINDCALQAWTMRGRGLPEHRFYVALRNAGANSGERFEELFNSLDVTERVAAVLTSLDEVVTAAREEHAALDLPQAAIAAHCRADYDCPFLDYCERGNGDQARAYFRRRTESP